MLPSMSECKNCGEEIREATAVRWVHVRYGTRYCIIDGKVAETVAEPELRNQDVGGVAHVSGGGS